MKRRTMILLSLILVFALVVTGCASKPAETEEAQAGPIVYKLGHIAAPDTAYDNFAKEFKRLVEEKSGGKYQIDIYSGGQLGVDRELMEALQAGNVQFTVITASDINQFVPEMGVQDLPFLFRDWDHVYKFLESPVSQELFALTDEVGMKTLGFMARGFRHVTSNVKPINTVADLKDLKIRVAESEVYINTFKALGTNAQAMAWGEVFTALQQGTIDAHENTIITTRDYKIDEVQKYMSETGHFFAFGALQMNKALLDGMSPEDQKLFTDAGYEASIALSKIQQENEAIAKTELESKGMVFNTVANKDEFVKAIQSVYETYLKDHSDTYLKAIQAL